MVFLESCSGSGQSISKTKPRRAWAKNEVNRDASHKSEGLDRSRSQDILKIDKQP
jgi:hypothetical protein